MTEPKISIIVPVYLSLAFLDKINDCLVNQSYQNIEIIYVNDGSPDISGLKCDDFAKIDKRIQVIHKENSGAAEALNTGIDYSSGDFMMFVDADDWIEKTTCKRALEVAADYNADMVFWLNTKEYGQKSVPYPPFFRESILFEGDGMTFLRRRMMGLIGNELKNPMQTDAFNAGWGKLYKSSIIKEHKIRWTATSLVGSSDVLFNAQLMPYVKRAYFLNEYLHHYNRYNPNSLTKTYRSSLFNKYQNLFFELKAVIQKNYANQKDFEIALQNRIALSIINITLSISSYKFSMNQLRELRQIFKNKELNQALKQLDFIHLPISFKVFLFFARLRNAFIVMIFGKIMNLFR